MQVRCICNDGAGILTLGRIYTVKREKCEFYYLQEFGTEEGLGWFKERFEVVPEKPNDLFTGNLPSLTGAFQINP